MPRVLCNSWPKAGTHAILELCRLAMGKGAWYRDADIKYPTGENELFTKFEERLGRYGGQSFAIKGHYGHSESINRFLDQHNFRHLFAVRDPREIICSTYRWLRDLRTQWEISRFLAPLSQELQIEHIITGLPILAPFDLDYAIRWDRPISERYAKLTEWIEAPNVCVLAYEDLTGMRGTGALHAAVEHALISIDISPKPSDVSKIARRICNPKATTFHTGPASDWTQLFTDRHRQLFVDTGGEALVERFGYAPTLPT